MGRFSYHGHHLFVITNHFNSKGGDQPLRRAGGSGMLAAARDRRGGGAWGG
jgi:predicted extracellular nuclease